MYGGQERQETETRATDISTRERGERGQVKRRRQTEGGTEVPLRPEQVVRKWEVWETDGRS